MSHLGEIQSAAIGKKGLQPLFQRYFHGMYVHQVGDEFQSKTSNNMQLLPL